MNELKNALDLLLGADTAPMPQAAADVRKARKLLADRGLVGSGSRQRARDYIDAGRMKSAVDEVRSLLARVAP